MTKIVTAHEAETLPRASKSVRNAVTVSTPENAVRYQIVIVFMIASAAALGATGVTLLAFRRLSSPEHRLRVERLTATGHVR